MSVKENQSSIDEIKNSIADTPYEKVSKQEKRPTISQDVSDLDFSSLANNPKIVDEIYAPEWHVYNDYLHHGYRINYKSHKDMLRSVFQLHNETTNIWTHLIGALVFTYIMFHTSAFFDPLYLTFQKFRAQVKNTNWSQFRGAIHFNGFQEVIKDILDGKRIGFYEKLLGIWNEFTDVVQAGWKGENGGKFREVIITILRGYPSVFTSGMVVNQIDGSFFSKIFELVRTYF